MIRKSNLCHPLAISSFAKHRHKDDSRTGLFPRSSSLAEVETYGIIKRERNNAEEESQKMKRLHERGRRNSILKSMIPGEQLKLRDGALGHIRPRQWIFNRVEGNDTILLTDESGGFGWSVKIDSIDWEEYERQKGKELSHRN